ncbi:MAG: YlbF family regulator [Clostridia bacterium]|nr:YlbF family regulator [Clostridia bacterium]
MLKTDIDEILNESPVVEKEDFRQLLLSKTEMICDLLEDSDEFLNYQEAKKRLNDTPASLRHFEKFIRKNQEYIDLMDRVSETDLTKMRKKLFDLVNEDPLVNEFFASESRFSLLFAIVDECLDSCIRALIPESMEGDGDLPEQTGVYN